MEDDFNEKLFEVRICHLKKYLMNNEFGFNLKAKTGEKCHIIGKVDPETPAFFAGLKSGDKIIEINNSNIHGLNYNEIMQKIKFGYVRNGKCYKDELLLMVIDNKIEEHYNKISPQRKCIDPNSKYFLENTTGNNKTLINGGLHLDKDINSSYNITYIDPAQIKYDKNHEISHLDHEEEYQITFI